MNTNESATLRAPVCQGCPLWDSCGGFDAKYCVPNADAAPAVDIQALTPVETTAARRAAGESVDSGDDLMPYERAALARGKALPTMTVQGLRD